MGVTVMQYFNANDANDALCFFIGPDALMRSDDASHAF
jgi:hypothetical protein